MRDYGKVAPSFWTGDTGRFLRQCGRDEQLVALYLITGPSANMIGLYHLALPLLSHHTGIDQEGALKALRRASEGGFCEFDEAAEEVWVPEMACYQIGPTLAKEDNRVKGVARELLQFRKSRFFQEFMERYGEAYHLNGRPELKGLASPSEAPYKPLRSQEQEQEQEITSPDGEESATPTPGPSVSPAEFAKAWNAVGRFTACRKMTAARLKHFRGRQADPSWASSWREALARAAASPFCRGENDRGWRADVDWFLRPDTVTKILEGKYDDRAPSNGDGASSGDAAAYVRVQADRAKMQREEDEARAGGGLAAFAEALRTGGGE